MASLKSEIGQATPFSSLEEEAILNVMRTSDCLQRAFQQKTRDWGLTSTQYNVLRILRGAQPEGLTCAAIGERMIAKEPDITRLLRRLKLLKLIRNTATDKIAAWFGLRSPKRAWICCAPWTRLFRGSRWSCSGISAAKN